MIKHGLNEHITHIKHPAWLHSSIKVKNVRYVLIKYTCLTNKLGIFQTVLSPLTERSGLVLSNMVTYYDIKF